MRLDCIVMAGGRATRMGGVVKPLLEVCGEPMVMRVVGAIRNLCKRIVVVYSDHTSGVVDLCRGPMGHVECVKGVGGYVEDLKLSLNLVSLPALVVPADMPFIDVVILEGFLLKALLTLEPVVNLVDASRGPVGVTLFKEREGSWADVVVEGGYKLLDVDTWSDYEEAVRICRDIMVVGWAHR
ncbi:MAG: NTP transferase domain-containing protein [Acidilobaceae archaeon]